MEACVSFLKHRAGLNFTRTSECKLKMNLPPIFCFRWACLFNTFKYCLPPRQLWIPYNNLLYIGWKWEICFGSSVPKPSYLDLIQQLHKPDLPMVITSSPAKSRPVAIPSQRGSSWLQYKSMKKDRSLTLFFVYTGSPSPNQAEVCLWILHEELYRYSHSCSCQCLHC